MAENLSNRLALHQTGITAVIQSRTTKQFFDLQKGKWTEDRDKATKFNCASDAVRICLRVGLMNVQIVMHTGDLAGENEVVVPLH